jgi:branched-subunit amino acid transport protein
MAALLILTTAGVGTWLLRASGAVLLSERELPELVNRGLEEARPALLAALLVITLTRNDGAVGLLTPSPLMVAAVITAFVAWRTGGMLRTMVAGMVLATVLSLLWG